MPVSSGTPKSPKRPGQKYGSIAEINKITDAVAGLLALSSRPKSSGKKHKTSKKK